MTAAWTQARHDQQAVVMRRADFRLTIHGDQRVAAGNDVAAAIGLDKGEIAAGRTGGG